MLIRQGDVLLISADDPAFRAPTGHLSPQPALEARVILAWGEATGHHHSVPAPAATLSLDEGGVTYLTVKELTEVSHPEHAPARLAPDTYEVRRQREWSDADEPRQVID